MHFSIIWDEKAYDELKKLEASIHRRIEKKVSELSEDPYLKDIKKLKGTEGYRLRVGDYRVIFEIEGNKIQILKVGHRRNIYD
ncbi:type II toxin-antitoxin system RelE/ParE family toxin [Candidatus Woesearchaeota archaeon]|nr:type II toxin-antitoxin system RelE/ParE family toxin [Candidatus Woesearchaeota archaeon]